MADLKDIISSRLQKAIKMRGIKGDKRAIFGGAAYGWIRGEVVPDTASVIQICAALEISADWLLGISNEEPVWLFWKGGRVYDFDR